MLGAGDAMVNKTDRTPSLMEFRVLGGRQIIKIIIVGINYSVISALKTKDQAI